MFSLKDILWCTKIKFYKRYFYGFSAQQGRNIEERRVIVMEIGLSSRGGEAEVMDSGKKEKVKIES